MGPKIRGRRGRSQSDLHAQAARAGERPRHRNHRLVDRGDGPGRGRRHRRRRAVGADLPPRGRLSHHPGHGAVARDDLWGFNRKPVYLYQALPPERRAETAAHRLRGVAAVLPGAFSGHNVRLALQRHVPAVAHGHSIDRAPRLLRQTHVEQGHQAVEGRGQDVAAADARRRGGARGHRSGHSARPRVGAARRPTRSRGSTPYWRRRARSSSARTGRRRASSGSSSSCLRCYAAAAAARR